MKVFFSDQQLGHAPQQFLMAGRFVQPFEVPDRARSLAHKLTAAGLAVHEPGDTGIEPIQAIHGTHYPEFLASAYQRFQALQNAGIEAFPNVHPHVSGAASGAARGRVRPTGIVGQLGWYVGDMACAIGPETWSAVYASAQSAIAAANLVKDGAPHAIALCRPPGHHAYRDRASGFCFLNNAAIAAQILRDRFAKVAILDFDTHHGDGTQAIFYNDKNVFVGSTHTNPDNYYPFYCGYADETGADAGVGTTLNIPLEPGSGDSDFLDANERLLKAAADFRADALVISAGWDAHEDDPLSKLRVSDAAYKSLGEIFGNTPRPTVIVQEGGYSLAAIERVAPSFVTAFAKTHVC
ncbi:MAG: histone deacetylase family protein [Pseudomonadota bacterium]